MLYVIFNSDGSINTLVVGESINQGSNNVNQVFASVKGYANTSYSCVAEFELPNGDLEELLGVRDTQNVGLNPYDGYTVSLSEAVTYLAGNLKMNLKLIDINENVLCTYQVTLKVNPTGYEPNDTHITEAQYNSLIQSLNSYALKDDTLLLITLDGTETIAELVELYGQKFSLYFKKGNDIYTLGCRRIILNSYEVEIESKTAPTRYLCSAEDTYTIDSIMTSTYQADYVTTKDITPTYFTATTTESDVDGTGYNGAKFTLPATSNKGLYVFSYSLCTVIIPAYDLVENTEYNVCACLNDGQNDVKVLTYKIHNGKFVVYNKDDYIVTGQTANLYRIKLF